MRRIAPLGALLALATGCGRPAVPPAPGQVFVVTNGIGTGEVRISLTKEGCGLDCPDVFGKGAAARLVGHTHPGSRFDGFSGPCTGRMPCVVPLDRPRWVAASFSDAAARYDRRLGPGRAMAPSSPRAIALDRGGGTAVAGAGEAWLGRFDREGQKAWDMTGGDKTATAVVFDSAFDIVVVGWKGSPPAAHVEKRTASGGPVWELDFVGPDARATDVAVDANGDVYVVGTFAGSLKAGNKKVESAGGSDVFVARVSPEGKPIDVLRLGGANSEHAPRVATDGALSVHVAYVAGGLDTYGAATHGETRIVSFAPFGQKAWEVPIEGRARVDVLRATTGGEIVVAGRFTGGIKLAGKELRARGDGDAMVAKLDRSGAALWAKSFGGKHDSNVTAMDVDPSGRIALFGTFQDTMEIGKTTLTAKRVRRTWHGGTSSDWIALDTWLSVLSPEGEVISAKAFGGSGTDFARAVTWAEGGDVVFLLDQEELDVGGEGKGITSHLERRLVRRPAEAP
ncbi:hypothetical protein [Polyangium sp. 6x1]|uniref:hypothetical protein n=1 Tax=Polyangium sp. 6x1 TaxID=3042689 RepID=UPI0024830250|nr:hypothetical protein [Polyangium sp. 6x1]MDI1445137.1 hypothetical protein [Polyangium sp. 6x1]